MRSIWATVDHQVCLGVGFSGLGSSSLLLLDHDQGQNLHLLLSGCIMLACSFKAKTSNFQHFTRNIPQGIVWCNQLVVKLATLLLELPGTPGAPHPRSRAVRQLMHVRLGIAAVRSGRPESLASGVSPAGGDGPTVGSPAVTDHSSGNCQQSQPERVPDSARVLQGSLAVLQQPEDLKNR